MNESESPNEAADLSQKVYYIIKNYICSLYQVL